MVKKLFISDCEGPISLNDNAFELSGHFIPQGEEFFTRVSLFDDYMVEEVKKPGYHAGDTLKLISPFLKAYGASNQKITDFSKENVLLVPGVEKSLKLIQSLMPTYIVSTSYQQYIQALCQVIGFPYENTYYTTLDLNQQKISPEETETLKKFKEEIVEGADFEKMYEIFFKKINLMESGNIIKGVRTVGGEGKKFAVEKILSENSLSSSQFMYVGDSITDVEPLRFARENHSLAISFNGNEYAIREASIAVMSPHSIVTSILADLYFKFNRDYVNDFVDSYSQNPERALSKFQVSAFLQEEFKEIFKDQELPHLEIITNENQDQLAIESTEYRKKVRGDAIGGLG